MWREFLDRLVSWFEGVLIPLYPRLTRGFPRISEKIRLRLLRLLLYYRAWLRSPKYLPFIGMLADNPRADTFDFQEVLPPLPVPSLKQTCNKYLYSVQPLLTEEEFVRTKAAVTEFQQPGGIGEQLQTALIERAESSRNWIEQWWLDHAYLSVRTSLVNINYFGVDCIEPPPARQIERTASFIASALKFKNMIDTETLRPDRLFGTLPICMCQYRRLFSTSRVPGIPKDSLVTYSQKESRHAVVIRKKQFFWFDVYHDDGSCLSRAELQRQLQQVVELTNDSDNFDPPVGVLTTENRSTWAKLRNKLIEENESNKASLEQIDRALFVVCLDDGEPQSTEEHARLMLHGDGGNRWFDKSLQIIVQKSGQLGPNVEHSRGETPTAIPLFDFAAADERKVETPPVIESRDLPPVNRIRWKINAEIVQAIQSAFRNFDAMVADFDIRVFAFDSFGKGFVKKCKFSPDGFVQMALQLAYFMMQGKRGLTYETASTRCFYHGNTDTIRSCSLSSMEFVTAMGQSDFSAETKFDFLKKAVDAHVKYMREAMAGEGVDRHLLGLRILAAENEPELPGIFTDKAYQMGWQLSTSQSPAHRLVVGFAQAVDDGYGISYLVKENSLHFIITSKKSCTDTDSTGFAASLKQSLLEMQIICDLAIRQRS